MILAWMSDLHLNFLSEPELDRFFHGLHSLIGRGGADAIVITGDIADARTLHGCLRRFDALPCPTYFVLGNHDRYHGSLGLRGQVDRWCRKFKNVRWLPSQGVVRLTPKTALVGIDGWYDCKYGDYWHTLPDGSCFGDRMNDFRLIPNFRRLSGARLNREAVRVKCRLIAGKDLYKLQGMLDRVPSESTHVYVATHVPPFEYASRYQGMPSPRHSLPYFSYAMLADELLCWVDQFWRGKQMTVLAGHTHDACEYEPLSNLKVLVAGAVYGRPEVFKLLEVE